MKKLVLTFTFLFATAALAQTPYLVRDINTTVSDNTRSSSPSNFFEYGSRTLFSAVRSGSSELWISDGTSGGTTQLATFPSTTTVPSRFVLLNGKVVFNATDSHGEQLWITDGTAAGTRLLAAIGSRSSSPGDRIVYHGNMYFSADDGIDGNELWVTDGTSAGTRLFKDLTPGSRSSSPYSFTLLNDTVFFLAGGLLWRTDGTDGGTAAFSNIDAQRIVVSGSRLILLTGTAVWVSDGTPAGTTAVLQAPLLSLPSGDYPPLSGLTSFGDRAVFIRIEAASQGIGYRLWITDGTAGGTAKLSDVDATLAYPTAVAANTLFFAGAASDSHYALWKTDGTAAGTTLVKDLLPGNARGSAPLALTVAGDRVFFTAYDETNSDRLWVTDGTAAGTRMIVLPDGGPFVASIQGVFLTAAGSNVWFAGQNAMNGVEPWRSDGTVAGTFMVANLATDGAPSSNPASLTAAGDLLYFNAWDGRGTAASPLSSVWRSDGTATGTVKLTDGYLSQGIPAGDSVFFQNSAQQSNAASWFSDGTPAGTRSADAFRARFPVYVVPIYVSGDTAFAIESSSWGYGALYAASLSSTAPGVSLGINGGRMFTTVAGKVIFFADGGLAVTDGTPAGTRLAYVMHAPDTAPAVTFDGRVAFITDGKLWLSDGTYDGTMAVADAHSGTVTVAGRKIFFTSDDHLWVSDGTAAGTRQLSVIPLTTPVAIGETVIFPVYNSGNTEPWISDGTEAGTHMLLDIYPGTTGSDANRFISADGIVYFAASDDVHGRQLWMTDGTAAGTRIVSDGAPVFSSRGPESLTRAGSNLYFAKYDAATGNELWALPLSTPAEPHLAIDDVRVSEGDISTTARFTVRLVPASPKPVTVAWATSDATAKAGSDYDAVSGTLTFAPGETSKSIEVTVRGDTEAENNESFLVTLSNAAGARLVKASGFAIIDDEADQTADLALSLDFSRFNEGTVSVNATNNGPRTATVTNLVHSFTPAEDWTTCEIGCGPSIEIIPTGATRTLIGFATWNAQVYHSESVSSSLRDPQPANNSVGWTANGFLAMDALFLTPGAKAKIWFTSLDSSAVSVKSSDPLVLAVPSTAPGPGIGKAASFDVSALAPGRATVTVTGGGALARIPLTIDVVAPGMPVRWPASIFLQPPRDSTFDARVPLLVNMTGTAPYTGHSPTGFLSASAGGVELGRAAVTPGATGVQLLPVYPPAVGPLTVTVSYTGDSEFLPMSSTQSFTVNPGSASILAGALERSGAGATLRVRVSGSPVSRPSGYVVLSEGSSSMKVNLLASGDPATSDALVTFTSLEPGMHTFQVMYSGDGHYNNSTQTIRIADPRPRAVRH